MNFRKHGNTLLGTFHGRDMYRYVSLICYSPHLENLPAFWGGVLVIVIYDLFIVSFYKPPSFIGILIPHAIQLRLVPLSNGINGRVARDIIPSTKVMIGCLSKDGVQFHMVNTGRVNPVSESPSIHHQLTQKEM